MLAAMFALQCDEANPALYVLCRREGAVPNIPVTSNHPRKICFGKPLYRERNLVEYFFGSRANYVQDVLMARLGPL